MKSLFGGIDIGSESHHVIILDGMVSLRNSKKKSRGE